jgi:hypothetical protein
MREMEESEQEAVEGSEKRSDQTPE